MGCLNFGGREKQIFSCAASPVMDLKKRIGKLSFTKRLTTAKFHFKLFHNLQKAKTQTQAYNAKDNIQHVHHHFSPSSKKTTSQNSS